MPAPNKRPASARRVTSARANTNPPEGAGSDAPRPPRPRAPQQDHTRIYIIAGVVFALVIVAAVGYSPFTRYLHTRTLDNGATLDERKRAADSLYARRDGSAYGIFSDRLMSKDALARDASAYGMAQIANELGASSLNATNALADAARSNDNLAKVTLAPLLGDVAEKAASKMSAKNDGWEKYQEYLNTIGKALLPDAANPTPDVRNAVVGALAKVRAPGVCAVLLNIAEHDADAAIKAKAIEGLPTTAMPDAVAALLKAVNSENKDLGKTARNAFVRIRDEAKSPELLPALDDPNEAVRTEIVSALGRRKNDYKAAEGMAKALKDSSIEIRKLAVKSIPNTGIAKPEVILPLFSDADESVRVAAAETLGELRDPEGHKVLLQAFATNPEGKTLDALIASLAKHGATKDIPSIAVIMDQLAKHPESFKSMSEALVRLTNAQQGPKRDAERREWTMERWKKWWANLEAREKLKDEGLAKLKKADSRGGESKKVYPELLKMTVEGLDAIEKCIEMSKADDVEDIKDLERLQFEYGKKKELFFKHQELDLQKK